MYFMAEEVKGAQVPEGYSLCYIPDIDPQNADIKWESAFTHSGAKSNAGKTLKDP